LIASALLVILIAFQLALAAGAPFGVAAWGGQNPGVLPGRLRVASAVVGLVVYPVILLVILAAAGIIAVDWLPFDPVLACWFLAGFFALGALVNAISRSPPERIWAIVSASLAVCCAVIALG
jgi:asparagine N-glycosylation enzyme membrane subunit Stt3